MREYPYLVIVVTGDTNMYLYILYLKELSWSPDGCQFTTQATHHNSLALFKRSYIRDKCDILWDNECDNMLCVTCDNVCDKYVVFFM